MINLSTEKRFNLQASASKDYRTFLGKSNENLCFTNLIRIFSGVFNFLDFAFYEPTPLKISIYLDIADQNHLLPPVPTELNPFLSLR